MNNLKFARLFVGLALLTIGTIHILLNLKIIPIFNLTGAIVIFIIGWLIVPGYHTVMNEEETPGEIKPEE